jgi:hydroxymethylglutaryl-CoA synthase
VSSSQYVSGRSLASANVSPNESGLSLKARRRRARCSPTSSGSSLRIETLIVWIRSRTPTCSSSSANLYFFDDLGNTYTGSLYLGLASLLHQQAHVLAGKRVGMFSYGSGNSSEFFSGVIGANATKAIAKADLDHLLASRQRIDMQEYETIMKMDPHTPPRTQAKAGAFRFTGMVDHKRQYSAG